jgi:hypothetical protein
VTFPPTFDDINFSAMMPQAAAAYTDARLSAIAEKYGCPESSIAELGQCLRTSGAVYLDMKIRAEEAGAWEPRKTLYARIVEGARNLAADIAALDEYGRELFWQPSEFPPGIRATPPGEAGPFGHTVRLVKMADSAHAPIYLRNEDISEALTIIHSYACRALSFVPLKAKGPPMNYALVHWVGNMRQIWSLLLKRRFTFSSEDGVPKSKAFWFCIDAMEHLDPSIDQREMITAVRAEMREARRYSSGKTGKNRS